MRGIRNVPLVFEYAGELRIETGSDVIRADDGNRTGRFLSAGCCDYDCFALGRGRHEPVAVHGGGAALAAPSHGSVFCIFGQGRSGESERFADPQREGRLIQDDFRHDNDGVSGIVVLFATGRNDGGKNQKKQMFLHRSCISFPPVPRRSFAIEKARDRALLSACRTSRPVVVKPATPAGIDLCRSAAFEKSRSSDNQKQKPAPFVFP